MKKVVMIIVGIILMGLGVLGLSLLGRSDKVIRLLVFSIAFIAVGIFLLIFGIKQKKSVSSNSTQVTAPAEQGIKREAAAIDCTKPVDMLPVNQDDLMKVYQYDQKLCIIRDDPDPVPYIIDKVKEGHRQLIFEFEPDNPHDDKAIMIKLDDKKIGYVYRDQTQDMIHSYFKSHYEVAAHINTVIGNEVMYKIAFYKPKDKCRENVVPFKNKKFVENVCEGEILEVRYSNLEDAFVADLTDGTIKLPKKAEEYASKYHAVPAEVGENCESLIFYK